MKVFRQEDILEPPKRPRKKATKASAEESRMPDLLKEESYGKVTAVVPYESTILMKTPKLGRRDPFRVYPTEQVVPYADLLMDHSKSSSSVPLPRLHEI